jgi:hypothetical protein
MIGEAVDNFWALARLGYRCSSTALRTGFPPNADIYFNGRACKGDPSARG